MGVHNRTDRAAGNRHYCTMIKRNPILILVFTLIFGGAAVLWWLGRFRAGLFVLLASLAAIALPIAIFRSGIAMPGVQVPAYLADLAAAVFVLALTSYLAFIVYKRDVRPVSYADWKYALAGFAIVSLILAAIVRTFVLQPFTIPAASMEPSLRIGDLIVVSKSTYGYSRHSFPFSMVPIEGRLFATLPKRGDIAVFKSGDPPIDYVKRIMGLPGETVAMRDGVLHIGGEPIALKSLPESESRRHCGDIEPCSAFEEVLPEGGSHIVLSRVDDSAGDNMRKIQVPAGHYFMLGDNRDNSNDSRFGLGFIPFENLVGRVSHVLDNDEGVSFDGRPYFD
jgi:signal peptidase I